MTHDVFISYASENEQEAQAILDFLQSRGFRCWIDNQDLRFTGKYDREIEQAIKRSRIVLWLASSQSIASDYVRFEITTAHHHKKPIGPIYLEPLDPIQFASPFNFILGNIQAIEWFQGTREKNLLNLANELQGLMHALPSVSDGAKLQPSVIPDDDWLLTPAEDAYDLEDSESGSQVIALDLEDDSCDLIDIPPMLKEDAVGPIPGDAADSCSSKTPLDSAMPMGSAPPSQTMPPTPVTDQVHFSVTTPKMMQRSNCYVIDVWAHLAERRNEVLALAREAQNGEEIRIKSKLGAKIARGTPLAIQLSIHGLKVGELDQPMPWDGVTINVTFPVEVPTDARIGTYPGIAVIHVAKVPLAKVHFVVSVGQEESSQLQHSPPARRYRSAFASYASKNRDEVLGRVQGIQKILPDLDVFMDVASLRSGQRWQEELFKEIDRRDIFYLFWSAEANESPYVEREWRAALTRRGIQYIDPVPLVSPEKVPPPPELARDLHFNDWILAYVRGKRE